MEQKKIVYIAGPMRGIKDYNHQAFFNAEQRLRGHGYIELNPAKLPIGMPDQNYFPICLAMIDAADEVYMLKDWYDSQGACLEREYATARGKKVFFQEDQIF